MQCFHGVFLSTLLSSPYSDVFCLFNSRRGSTTVKPRINNMLLIVLITSLSMCKAGVLLVKNSGLFRIYGEDSIFSGYTTVKSAPVEYHCMQNILLRSTAEST